MSARRDMFAAAALQGLLSGKEPTIGYVSNVLGITAPEYGEDPVRNFRKYLATETFLIAVEMEKIAQIADMADKQAEACGDL